MDADSLIDACISAGLTVPPDLIDDAQALRSMLAAYRLRQLRRETQQAALRTGSSSTSTGFVTARPSIQHTETEPTPLSTEEKISHDKSVSQAKAGLRQEAEKEVERKPEKNSVAREGVINNEADNDAAQPQSVTTASGITIHPIKILKNYTKPPKKYVYDDFVKYFNKRYQAISGILRQRKELENVTSINRIIGKRERESTAIIGIVSEKKEAKTKHTILTVEDPTGKIEVWLSANNREMTEVAREIVLDEVIGIIGQAAGDRMFANSIVFPDIPPTHERVFRTNSRRELRRNTRSSSATSISERNSSSKTNSRSSSCGCREKWGRRSSARYQNA